LCSDCVKKRKPRKIIDYLKVLKGEETTLNYSKLRAFVLAKGFKENKCEECGITEWNGKPLVIQLHHKDGNRKNSKLENLKMACPNCHSQTETWGIQNKKRKK
jgi:Zn finger protein HypA/HybF involved in hydrogenase expression